MQLPDEAPKLPKLPFLIGDVVLIATAAVIAQRSAVPLAPAALLAIVACVAVGAVLAVLPFLVDYARRQDAALTDRQNSLEALARTTTAAAEQIGIAASGMHTIGELVHKNLKVADQLPHKLQEKINEFHQQRDEAAVAENEALTQEVNSLRSSEAEKLEAVSTRIHKTASDLAKAESALQTNLAALREAIDRLPDAIELAGTRAGTAVAQAGDEALAKILAEIDVRLAAAAGTLAARASLSPVPGKPARKSSLVSSGGTAPSATQAADAPARPQTAIHGNPADSAQAGASPTTSEETPSDQPPKTEAFASTPPAPIESPTTPKPAPAPDPRKRARKEPFAAPSLPGLLDPDEADHITSAAEEATTVDGPEESETHGSGELERSLSADGLTRLVVTAYIGIGNRLFVRGDGPGLSREKGVPLQFVSIGKWRWESPDATVPVELRIFKNDQVECPSLGAITLEPGQQGEVTAAF